MSQTSLRAFVFASIVALAGCGSSAVTGSSGALACVTLAACSGGSVSSCTSGIAGVNNDSIANSIHVSGAEVNCVAGAGNDCNKVRRCLNGGTDPQACTGGAASCAGSVYHFCGNLTGQNGMQATQQYDCASGGEMCVGSGNTIDCGLGTCSGGAATCMGNVLQSCQNGILHQFDCGMYAATCVSTVGISHCRGTGSACTSMNPLNPLQPVRCDGSTLVVCADGQEARWDCSRLNEGCFAKSDGTLGCALGGECDPSKFSATCVGMQLNYCNNGKKASVDCAALGFHGCDAQTGRCTL